jgi:hypothetical protein
MAMSDDEASLSRGRGSGRPPAAAPRTALDAVTARRLRAATTSMSAGAWRTKPGGRGIRRTTEMSGDLEKERKPVPRAGEAAVAGAGTGNGATGTLGATLQISDPSIYIYPLNLIAIINLDPV